MQHCKPWLGAHFFAKDFIHSFGLMDSNFCGAYVNGILFR